jgi:glutaredoxin 3
MKTVTIYSTPVCKYCGHAKEFFKKHNIQYTEHNVAADQNARAEMIDISGQMGVPVIRIDDNIVIGYDEEALKELLLA